MAEVPESPIVSHEGGMTQGGFPVPKGSVPGGMDAAGGSSIEHGSGFGIGLGVICVVIAAGGGLNTILYGNKTAKEKQQSVDYPAMSITIAEDGKFRRSLSDTGVLAKDNALNWCTHMDKQRNCSTVLTITERNAYCIAIAKDFTNRNLPIYEKFYNVEKETLSKRRMASVNQKVMEIDHVSYFCNTDQMQNSVSALSSKMDDVTSTRAAADKKRIQDETREAFEMVAKMPPPVRTENPPGNRNYVLKYDVPLRPEPSVGVESLILPPGTCVTALNHTAHSRFSKVFVPSLNEEGWMPKGTLFPAPDCGSKDAGQQPKRAAPQIQQGQSAAPPVSNATAFTVVASRVSYIYKGPSQSFGVAAIIRPGDCVRIEGTPVQSGFEQMSVQKRQGLVTGWVGHLEFAQGRTCSFN